MNVVHTFTRRPSCRAPLFVAQAVGLACALSACPAPEEEPVYDDELGLQAASTEPGALAGSFVLKTSIVSLADIPVVEDTTAGGESYYLVERSWDEAAQGYTQTTRLCGGRIYETGGTTSEVTPERWLLVPPIETASPVYEHGPGTMTLTDHVELWAIDLDDPVNDPMPANGEEASQAPWASRIFDADEDGNPGMTMIMSGLAIGEVYFCQRKTLNQLSGYVLSEDETAGLIDEYLFEQVVVGASSPLLNQQLPRERHPNPKEAWFWEHRIDDGGGCDEVLDAVADEVVPRVNPFL